MEDRRLEEHKKLLQFYPRPRGAVGAETHPSRRSRTSARSAEIAETEPRGERTDIFGSEGLRSWLYGDLPAFDCDAGESCGSVLSGFGAISSECEGQVRDGGIAGTYYGA